MKTLNLVAAALGGALVGAAAALLLAPQSGSKTREDITDFIKERCPSLKKSKIEQLADQLEADIYQMKGLLTFLGGAVAGAAIAALLTPESGEDLRFRIKALLRKKGILPSTKLDDFVEMIATEIEEGKQ